MEFLSTVLYFLVAIGILVSVHEFGHFIAARIFKVRVEKFYVGFDPWNAKLFSFKRGDTEYGIGWIPLGGYVKLSGMEDESFDKSFKHKPVQPYEFRSKPVWQRIIILAGGVIMNFLLAAFVFSVILISYGTTQIANAPVDVRPDSPFSKIGFQTGDKILYINDKKVTYWNDIHDLSELSKDNLSFRVKREDGSVVKVSAPDNFLLMFSGKPSEYVSPLILSKIGRVVENSPASMAGIREGDLVTSINGVSIKSWSNLVSEIQKNKDQEFSVRWSRGAEEMSTMIKCDESGKIGVVYANQLKQESIEVSALDAIQRGFSQATTITALTFSGIGKIITGDVDPSKSIAGPIKIAQLVGESARNGLKQFLQFLAVISVSLAVLNILPIPGLDGGHIVINLIEGIVRKPLSFKLKERIQQVGVTLLLMLIAYVIYNDIANLSFL